MFAYVLTFILMTGGTQTVVEVPNLQSVEQCRTIAKQRRDHLPRGTHMIRPVCAQRGYFT